MSKDSPIVDEVRRRRHKISEKFGHDLRKYGEHLMELQKEYQDRLVDRDTIAKFRDEDQDSSPS
ncbi:MAG: hypothetical protein ACE5EC_05180 [Phycisphaerae bacterium]